MNHILLKEIAIHGSLVSFRYETRGVSDLFLTDELWIDYGRAMDGVPYSILVIPFISIVLPIAWVTNATVWVNEIDKTFYDSTFRIRRAYSDLYPKYPLTGKIVSAYIRDNKMSGNTDGYMLFSGGIDAHASYINNVNSIKCLVNIQGWYNSVDEKNSVAEADFRDIEKFSIEQQRMFYSIRSNFARIISTDAYRQYAKKIGDSLWHGFQHSMAFISITIPVVYKNNGGKIIIASSFTVGDERVCASYPTTDNEFRYAGNGVVQHDGFELSRQDKIKVIVNHQRLINRPYPIRVCSFNDHNCCKCEKCFRTILGFVAEGVDIKNFGFYLDKPILEFYVDYFERNLAQFGVKNESITHWPHIKKRMRDNYQQNFEYRAFIDWFLAFDFTGKRRTALRQYYMRNFWSILRRKITGSSMNKLL